MSKKTILPSWLFFLFCELRGHRWKQGGGT